MLIARKESEGITVEKKCQCCGQTVSGTHCGYCGFDEVIGLGDSGAQSVSTLIRDHRQKLLNSVKALSVTAYELEWKDSRPVYQKKEQTIAKGIECYPDGMWSQKTFGQFCSGEDLSLKLSCRIGGKKKQLSCKIPSKPSGDFWRIGLRIDDSLRLKVFLGTPESHTQSQWIPLKWE